MRVFLAIVMLL